MTDTTKAFELEDGVAFAAPSGTTLWIGGGDTVPTFNAPQGSVFFLQDSKRYVQEGVGFNNQWQESVSTDNLNVGGVSASYTFVASTEPVGGCDAEGN